MLEGTLGGLDITGNAKLIGGAIISSADPTKNQLTAADFSYSDLANHSQYKGDSFSIGAGIGFNANLGLGKHAAPQSSVKQTDAKGKPVIDPNTKQPKLATGRQSLQVNRSIGYGKDSDQQNSTTYSGINTGNITITNPTAQQQQTGQTAAQAAAAIHTSTTTERVAANSGRLNNRFDKEAVQQEVATQVAITKQLDKNRQALKKSLLNKANQLFLQAQQKRKENGGKETEESLALEQRAHKISKTVSYIDTGLGALWGSAGGIKLAAKQVVVQHADYAKNAATHITAGQLYKIDCSGEAAQRYCKGADKWEGGAREIYDLEAVRQDKGNVIVSNPGIYNDKSSAFRNAVKQNPEAAKNGNLYVVVNNPSYEVIPGLSEVVFYAGYDKLNDKLGAILPITNAERTNVRLNIYAEKHGIQLEKSNHSRGGLTESVSLQRTHNMGIFGIPIVETRFFGTATNVESYLKHVRKNDYKNPQSGTGTTVKAATHQSDFVGRIPVILGNNPPTGGTCWLCYSHSSYYGVVPDEHLKDANDKAILDINGKEIPNPEYKEYTDVWGEPKLDSQGKPINASAPKEVRLDANNKIYIVE